jgi:hypothetical protein
LKWGSALLKVIVLDDHRYYYCSDNTDSTLRVRVRLADNGSQKNSRQQKNNQNGQNSRQSSILKK